MQRRKRKCKRCPEKQMQWVLVSFGCCVGIHGWFWCFWIQLNEGSMQLGTTSSDSAASPVGHDDTSCLTSLSSGTTLLTSGDHGHLSKFHGVLLGSTEFSCLFLLVKGSNGCDTRIDGLGGWGDWLIGGGDAIAAISIVRGADLLRGSARPEKVFVRDVSVRCRSGLILSIESGPARPGWKGAWDIRPCLLRCDWKVRFSWWDNSRSLRAADGRWCRQRWVARSPGRRSESGAVTRPHLGGAVFGTQTGSRCCLCLEWNWHWGGMCPLALEVHCWYYIRVYYV